MGRGKVRFASPPQKQKSLKKEKYFKKLHIKEADNQRKHTYIPLLFSSSPEASLGLEFFFEVVNSDGAFLDLLVGFGQAGLFTGKLVR